MRLSVSTAIVAYALGLGASAVLAPAVAQPSIEIAATVGVYVPYSSPFQGDLGGGVASMYGVEVRLWSSPAIGLQLDAGATMPVTYGPAGNPGGGTTGGTGQVRAIAAQVLFAIAGDPRQSHLWLSAGVGATQHSGTAYAWTSNPTSLSGVLGLGGALHIASGLDLQGGATTLIYRMNVYDHNGSLGYSTQYDLLVTTGLSWHFQ